MPSPDLAIRDAIAAAFRQSLSVQLSKATTARGRHEIFSRIRAELDDVLVNATPGVDAMSDLRTRAMLATLMHEVAEEFAAEIGAALDEEQRHLAPEKHQAPVAQLPVAHSPVAQLPAARPPAARLPMPRPHLVRLRIPAGDLAALCARAKMVLTEARTQARRTKVAHRSEAGVQHARRLERIGLALLTVGELADVAAVNEPGQEVVLMREQAEVLETVLDGG